MDVKDFVIMDFCLFMIVITRIFILLRIVKEIIVCVNFAESEKNLSNMRRTVQKVMTSFDEEFAIWWSKSMIEKIPEIFASDSWKKAMKEELEKKKGEKKNE